MPDVSAHVRKAVAQQLLQWMPLVSVYSKPKACWTLINLCEFHGADIFADFITVAQDDVLETGTETQGAADLPQTPPIHLEPLRRGPKPVRERFPQIVQETLDFIQLHGFSAQERRRTANATGSGVTLADVQAHLIATVPGRKSISQ